MRSHSLEAAAPDAKQMAIEADIGEGYLALALSTAYWQAEDDTDFLAEIDTVALEAELAWRQAPSAAAGG